MQRRTIPVCILFLNLLIPLACGFAEETARDSLLLQGIHQVQSEDYHGAVKTYETMIRQFPEHPIGYFCAAAVYQTAMRNYRINTYESLFDSLINQAITVGNQTVEQGPPDAAVRLYLGQAYGYRGLHKSRNGSFFAALKDGLKGVSHIKTALKIDPEMYDAYCALGSYHYWRAAKGKVLSIFFRNDKEKGIEEILQAIDRGKFVAVDGQYVLVAINYDRGDYQQALGFNQGLFDRFPTNPSCLYMRGRIYERLENWQEAHTAIALLLDHLRASAYPSAGYEVECLYRLAWYEYKSANPDRSVSYLARANALVKERDASKELEGPLEKFKEIADDMARLRTTLMDLHKTGTIQFDIGSL